LQKMMELFYGSVQQNARKML